jgi:hypothetical protein
MFLESMQKHADPSYQVNYSLASNIRKVVFEKNNRKYEYHLFILSQEEYMLIVGDLEAHRELPLIFNTTIFNKLNQELIDIRHDFNFMNLFCFGADSTFQPNSVEDIIRTISLPDGEAIEYAGMVIGDEGISFMITYKLKFNIHSGDVRYEPCYTYFEPLGNNDINEDDWSKFKEKFMIMNGSKKIDKKLSELTFFDAPIVQMVNI